MFYWPDYVAVNCSCNLKLKKKKKCVVVKVIGIKVHMYTFCQPVCSFNLIVVIRMFPDIFSFSSQFVISLSGVCSTTKKDGVHSLSG